jgi:ferric-dicitrate binding protein FerR (iron transport regulator)
MVRFILTDESLKSQTLTGRFRADDVDALLASLRVNFDIAHEFVGDNRVVLSELDDS